MMGEVNVLKELVIWVVVTAGVPGLTVILLRRIDAIPGSWFERLTYGWKRFTAVVIAGAFVTAVWLFGLYAGYFAMPEPTMLRWMEAWVAIIFPAGLLQQLIQGFVDEKNRA